MMAVPAGRLYPELSPADSGALLDSGAPLGPDAQAGFDAPAGSNTAGSRQSLAESRGGTSGAVIVQGTIDAYFEEEGRLVLVDYKSDRIEPGREGDLLRRYSGQIRLYAEALEGFSGKKIGEMLLYSLPLGKAILV
jgi:ATP-dependent exoDNAse (exonuclease V) beta subunit